jgi:hypothetical protein
MASEDVARVQREAIIVEGHRDMFAALPHGNGGLAAPNETDPAS